MKKLFLLVLAMSVSEYGFSQLQDSLLMEAIRANTYELRLEGNRLAGNGSGIIRDAIRDSQFLLVGEQHGIAEVSAFTKALFLEAIPNGFEYLCIETDPYIAAKLEELAKGGEKSYLEFSGIFPMSIPFYDSREEFGLIREAVTVSNAKTPVVWGVDQVFMTVPRYLFSLLAEQAPNNKARELALSYLDRAKAAFEEVARTNNPGKLIINSLTPEDYKKFEEAFGKDMPAASKKILEDMQKTQQVYHLWASGKQYENNRTRSRLMKEQFMDYYGRAMQGGKLPKVVFKFGSTHTYRGLSFYNQFDLGNMVSELAEMNGTHSVHFNISGITGKAQGAFGPPQPFDRTGTLHPVITRALDDRIKNDNWILVDMRPLRSQLKSTDLKPVKDIAFGYDFWIYVPEAQPVTK